MEKFKSKATFEEMFLFERLRTKKNKKEKIRKKKEKIRKKKGYAHLDIDKQKN